MSPQGGVISPLLANLYLHLLDRIWERQKIPQRLGARIVRYADDIVILCRNGTEQPMALLQHIMERLDLTLNEVKTKTVNTYEERFDFLGFEIGMGKSQRTGNHYPHVQPSKRAIQTIKDRVTFQTRRNRTVMPLSRVIREVNTTLRGWVGYFHVRNCSKALQHVRSHAEQRLQTHLRKRHKVRNRKAGEERYCYHVLYAKYGLYRVPTTAGWKKVHALQ